MEKFAGYGFNKSHSAAYAVLAYQTAWLKANHPAAFMAAVMTTEMDNTDALVVQKRECAALGIELLPPDVNVSSMPLPSRMAAASATAWVQSRAWGRVLPNTSSRSGTNRALTGACRISACGPVARSSGGGRLRH